MKHTCSGCVRSWTGTNMAHCAACHDTFSCVQHFDAHRVGGTCNDLGKVIFPEKHAKAGQAAYRLNKHGVWVSNVDKPEFWEAA